MTTQHIHIQWEGPYSFQKAKRLNGDGDYGLYQVYGAHPLYGQRCLLYIGKCDEQTFSRRISQHSEWLEKSSNASFVEIHIGRIARYEDTQCALDWSEQITIAESMLIYAHAPSANSSGLNKVFDEQYSDIHVLNWGDFRHLLPEVSGARYSTRFLSYDGYGIYKL